MGREIKRVPLDFDWPVGQRWHGYLSPYRFPKCPHCDQTGLNPATHQISKDFYGHNSARRWCDQITQDEVQALVDKGRLMDFTHVIIQSRWTPKDPPYVPTAEEVNQWQRRAGIGHDAINRHILIRTRATRLGVYGQCDECKGEGNLATPELRAAADAWEPTEPPSGPGWQLWETVSEGSPISPVFATADDLIDWMCRSVDEPRSMPWAQGWARNVAEDFVKRQGWAMSGAMINGQWMSGAEAALIQKDRT